MCDNEEKITGERNQSTYFLSIPSWVCWWVGNSVVDRSTHNGGDGDGGDEAPGGLPINAWPHPNHLLNVIAELLMAINIGDDDGLKEGNDDESHRASKGVKHAKPVLSSARTEDEANQETGETYTTCKGWDNVNV